MTTDPPDAVRPVGPLPLPAYHLRPSHGWLNDPNGTVRHDGRWHVFFQHNPQAPVHHRIQWGHASSPDLVTWTEHPVAFGPQPGGPDEFGCWTGAFVEGLDRPAVVYSGVADDSLRSTVCLRWGSPDLMTWSDPVVVAETPAVDGVGVMRDPYVFTLGGHRWGLLGAGLDDGTPAVLLFSCDDVLEWRYEGVWVSTTDAAMREGAPGDIWECPQVVTMGDTAVLVVSTQLRGVLGDVVAATGRLVLHEGRPRFDVERVDLVDRGTSFYAPQVVPDGDRPMMIGWLREEDPSLGRSVAGCLSLPRRLSVVDGSVRVSLDLAVAGLVAGGGRDVGEGVHEIPDPGHVLVLSGIGTLTTEGAGVIDVPEGSTVWVDVDVLEVFPGDGSTPVTVRHPSPWSLTLPAGGGARLSAVVPPLRS